ncbi:hypothetical protein A6035_00740 [Dietzia lutea]|uniref:Uncharacterized protein n=3 Tax=Dietzia lutea TaxID=546160 RepID=A0A2S1R3S7_9ACTN|nr:hypothetical protein A6035_00740 [Dietzia lutea]
MWFAVFRLARRESMWDYLELRQSAQDHAMRNIAKFAPAAVVIGFDGTDRGDMGRARQAGRRLIDDLRYASNMLYSHEVSAIVVIVRSEEERELLEEMAWRGDFHDRFAYWSAVVDLAALVERLPGSDGAPPQSEG